MSRFRFNKMLEKMSALKRELPIELGNMGQRFFVDAFRKEGWTDRGFIKWAPRKDKSNLRPLLIGKSGGTKNAAHIHLRQSVNTSLKKSTWDEILFMAPQKYAAIHNEGGEGLAFGKYKFTMPQRKFMGNSHVLIGNMSKRVNLRMNQVLKAR